MTPHHLDPSAVVIGCVNCVGTGTAAPLACPVGWPAAAAAAAGGNKKRQGDGRQQHTHSAIFFTTKYAPVPRRATLTSAIPFPGLPRTKTGGKPRKEDEEEEKNGCRGSG
ncbi:hypothetical protein T310_9375 [Rasamsonia emersonii CBS 393.64]|uniref:Uncharacterized protein n=1 Tax=Rasamsonia emersonii (strain ATCC 16479 / CBS 393.64 / IMI 116815) TaxID=1408163 RepID=A0A0F4YFH9_RASE3|nr:hypothetical protein T310_9375 [Rasamsonia emersonii CBS 393.64]KKA17007.1 hypothetical protein T310_9375 [Rasamsonia emersonii CBS 393.64]